MPAGTFAVSASALKFGLSLGFQPLFLLRRKTRAPPTATATKPMTPSQSTAAPVSGSEGVEGVSVGVEGVSEGVEGTGGTGAPGVVGGAIGVGGVVRVGGVATRFALFVTTTDVSVLSPTVTTALLPSSATLTFESFEEKTGSPHATPSSVGLISDRVTFVPLGREPIVLAGPPALRLRVSDFSLPSTV